MPKKPKEEPISWEWIKVSRRLMAAGFTWNGLADLILSSNKDWKDSPCPNLVKRFKGRKAALITHLKGLEKKAQKLEAGSKFPYQINQDAATFMYKVYHLLEQQKLPEQQAQRAFTIASCLLGTEANGLKEPDGEELAILAVASGIEKPTNDRKEVKRRIKEWTDALKNAKQAFEQAKTTDIRLPPDLDSLAKNFIPPMGTLD